MDFAGVSSSDVVASAANPSLTFLAHLSRLPRLYDARAVLDALDPRAKTSADAWGGLERGLARGVRVASATLEARLTRRRRELALLRFRTGEHAAVAGSRRTCGEPTRRATRSPRRTAKPAAPPRRPRRSGRGSARGRRRRDAAAGRGDRDDARRRGRRRGARGDAALRRRRARPRRRGEGGERGGQGLGRSTRSTKPPCANCGPPAATY